MGICNAMCIKKRHDYNMKILMEKEKSLKKKIRELESKSPMIKEDNPIKTSSVELSISCQNLPNMDSYGYSDPICIVSQVIGNTLQKIGQTEVINDNLNPFFKKVINLNYNLEDPNVLQFEIYDVDSIEGEEIKEKQLIGVIRASIHEILGSSGQTLSKPLKKYIC